MRQDRPEPLFMRRIRAKRHDQVSGDQDKVALEARLIEQDHRFVATWSAFINRKQWDKGDPRRRAAVVALLWRFVPKVVPAAIFITFGGVLGGLMAYKANQLIDVQNNLAEAQRRSSLNIELSAIMDEISKEVKENRKKKLTKGEKHKLDSITEVRIIALSRSLEPYRSLKTDQRRGDSLGDLLSLSNVLDDPLSDSFLSPERGQLLVSLVGLQKRNDYDVSNILRESDFSQARLVDAQLSRADLGRANLRGSDLRGAKILNTDLNGAALFGANLSRADLKDTDLNHAYLRKSDLSGAILIGADLGGADLREVDLSLADLGGAHLRLTDLSGAVFGGANLIAVDLSGAVLTGADLDGIDLRWANLIGADLSGVKNIERIREIKGAKLSRDAAELFKSWALEHGAVLVDDKK